MMAIKQCIQSVSTYVLLKGNFYQQTHQKIIKVQLLQIIQHMQTAQSPKTIKTNTKWAQQPQKQASKRSYVVKQHNTQGLNSHKLNRQVQSYKSKTEQPDDYEKTATKKFIKSEKQFSEQYLSLVNKLRVNLSKQQFQRKRSKVIVFKERKSQRTYLSHQLKNYISESSFSKQNLPARQKKILISYQFGKGNLKENRQAVQKLDLSHLRLSLQNKKLPRTLQKTNNQQNSEIRYLELQSNRMTQNQFTSQKTNNNLSKKLSLIKQERKKIKLKPIQHQHSVKNFFELKEINLDYSKVEELCFHTEILLNIYEMLNSKEMTQVITINFSYSLKRYILGHKKFVDQNQRQIYDDISNIQYIFKKKQSQERMRSLVLLQRVIILYSIDLIANSNLKNYRNQSKQVLQCFLGLYIYLLYVIKEYKNDLSSHFQQSFQIIDEKVKALNIHLKKQLQTLYQFIYKRLIAIMKTNPTLMQQLKILIAQFQKRNVGINRSFYQILKVYAIYLNNNQVLIQKNYNLLKTFSTCPSPYLTKPINKIYTLVLDLDQTLIYSQNDQNKLQIYMRPFVKQFLTLMSQNYQIVIFTSSLPQYSEEIINQLPCIDHRLYRYHTTRLRNKFMKDLSRLGRPLDKVIIIDNDEQSFALQSENGIKITEWRGADSTDQELNILALFLNNFLQQKIQDVRSYISTYKQFRMKYH